MIISDGVTDLTFLGTQTDEFLRIEQSSAKTAGGGNRTIRAGKRFAVIEKIRMTGTEYGTLTDLLLNGASNYYYTPTNTPDFMSSTDFPMSVKISIPKKNRAAGGGDKKYYIQLSIEGDERL